MHQIVDIGDGQLNVYVRGAGIPLLMVHGFPLDHTMWSAQWEPLASEAQLIVPDLRGFGQSSPIPADVWTMEQFADDLVRMLDALQITQPVAYCGLSMGGYVGWQFWLRHRTRLSRLIACDTRAASDSPEVVKARHYMADRALREGTPVALGDMLTKLVAPLTNASPSPLIQQIRKVMQTTSPETIAAAQRGMAQRADITDHLPRIDVPTLAICGEYDQITPPDEMRAMAAQIQGAIYQEVPGAGHLSPAENPEAFNRYVERDLAAAQMPEA